MANYKHYDDKQSVFIPLNYSEQFIPGTLLFAINHLIEERIDCSGFDKEYRNDTAGSAAYNPKILLKIVLYAYSLGINTSRKIEKLCQKHVEFMALTGGLQPKKSTIADFVSSLGSHIDTIFEHVLLICEQEDLLGGTTFALDGVKLPSNASKESSGTHSELKHKRDKFRQKVKKLRQAHLESDKPSHAAESDEEKRKRQIKKLEQQAARIDEFLKENSPKKGRKKKRSKVI